MSFHEGFDPLNHYVITNRSTLEPILFDIRANPPTPVKVPNFFGFDPTGRRYVRVHWGLLGSFSDLTVHDADTHREIARSAKCDFPNFAPSGRWLTFRVTPDLQTWESWLVWLTGTNLSAGDQHVVISLTDGTVARTIRDGWSSLLGITDDDHLWTYSGYDVSGIGSNGPIILKEWSPQPTDPSLRMWLLTAVALAAICADLCRTWMRRCSAGMPH